MSRNLLYHKPLLFLQMKATSVLKHLFCIELLVHLTFSLRLHLIPTNNYRAWDHSSDLGMLILYRSQTAASSHLPKTGKKQSELVRLVCRCDCTNCMSRFQVFNFCKMWYFDSLLLMWKWDLTEAHSLDFVPLNLGVTLFNNRYKYVYIFYWY